MKRHIKNSLAYVDIKVPDPKKLDNLLKVSGIAGIARHKRRKGLSTLYVPLYALPDSDYAEACLKHALEKLPADCEAGEIVITEGRTLKSYVTEERRELESFDVVEQWSYTVEDSRDVAEVCAEYTRLIEEAIDRTPFPYVYDYDIRQNSDTEWKIRFWVMECNVGDASPVSGSFMDDIERYLPVAWTGEEPGEVSESLDEADYDMIAEMAHMNSQTKSGPMAISRITIEMRSNDHNPPHVHIMNKEGLNARFLIETGDFLDYAKGSVELSSGKLKKIEKNFKEWMECSGPFGINNHVSMALQWTTWHGIDGFSSEFINSLNKK